MDVSAMSRNAPDAGLRREVEHLRAENARLRAMLEQVEGRTQALSSPLAPAAPGARMTLFEDDLRLPPVDARSSAGEMVALFRALFAGREDVHAIRWDNARTHKSGWSPAVVGGPANARRPDREYVPLSDAVVEAHLSGRTHPGIYPLLPDDTCRPLACDFDGDKVAQL